MSAPEAAADSAAIAEELRPGANISFHFDTPTISCIALTLLFWSSSFSGIRAVKDAFGPAELALLRFIVASLALLAVAPIMKLKRLEVKDIPGVAMMGLVGVCIYHVALNKGEQTVPAGTASFIIATVPVFSALLAAFFLHERLSKWGWLGIAISVAGVMVIALGKGEKIADSKHTLDLLWIVLSAFTGSVYVIMQKHYVEKYGAFGNTAYSIWIGTLLMFVFAPGLLRDLKIAKAFEIWTVVYLGIFPAALAYVVWAYVIKRLPASVASSFLNLMPALSLFVAWVWLREIPPLTSVFGGAVALLGIVLVTFCGRPVPVRPE